MMRMILRIKLKRLRKVNQTKQDANVEQESDDTPTEETPEMSNIMEAYSKAIARK